MTVMQIRCDKGHFYNPNDGECPYCKNQKSPKQTYGRTEIVGDPSPTEPFGKKDVGKTVIYEANFNPAVGWLICTDGNERGRDFRLHGGQNFIGRNSEMSVYLSDDTVSEKKHHTVIIFDPVHNKFYVRPGEGTGNTYLNGELVMEARPLKSYDVIGVGTVVKLLFIPLCGEQFQWTPAAVTTT